MANYFMFFVLSFIILLSAILCIVTKRIMRVAAYMFFVLLGIAGLFFLLGYTFLGTAQIAVYVGGVTILYIFAIQLLSRQTLKGLVERLKGSRVVFGGIMTFLGAVMTLSVILTHPFEQPGLSTPDSEMPMRVIGNSLLGSGKYQYILPFEFISIFLLACIIGGIVISRKEERSEE
ncbi:MAG TPA: NADH-quinone oxidoreductase subunit J [Porphyromonadaceae bacterium]|nr:NADH-quinone oxidoreductase subunit J [Porphyromonadaceae bacterium]